MIGKQVVSNREHDHECSQMVQMLTLGSTVSESYKTRPLQMA
jgi:hypothetical protein